MFSLLGRGIPAFCAASLHLRWYAIFLARVRIVCKPSFLQLLQLVKQKTVQQAERQRNQGGNGKEVPYF